MYGKSQEHLNFLLSCLEFRMSEGFGEQKQDSDAPPGLELLLG
jgi:hypothetical protein